MEKTSYFKKAPLKTLRVLDPIKTSPFVVPTTTGKEAPTGNAPTGAIPLKAVTNHFPQVGRNRISEAPGVKKTQLKGTRAWKPLLPMTPFKLPSSRRSPPFFQKRLAHKQMFRQCGKHYHQWLRSSIHLKTKFNQSPTDSIRLQGPSKRISSD